MDCEGLTTGWDERRKPWQPAACLKSFVSILVSTAAELRQTVGDAWRTTPSPRTFPRSRRGLRPGLVFSIMMPVMVAVDAVLFKGLPRTLQEP